MSLILSGLLHSTKLKEGEVFVAETKVILSLFLANGRGGKISVEKLPQTCLFFTGREEKAII